MVTHEDLLFFQVLSTSTSLAEAARRLNVTPPAVTQRLRALETRVGVKLVDRNPRGLRLTDEGELIATEGVNIAHALEDLAERLSKRTEQVRGNLRVAAPYGFGRRYVASVMQSFAATHPFVTVKLDLSENPVRQVAETCDLIVHIGALPESDRLVTTLAPNRRILCAAPAYLDANGPIRHPQDLSAHKCLALRENSEDVTLWRFAKNENESVTVRIKPVMSSNDGEIIRQWALAGMGVMVRSEWDVVEDLEAGNLQEVLPEWRPPSADVVALLHARHGRSGRTSAFLQCLRESLSPVPWRALK
ncbi:LysR family transcriptional regulator [Novosphingobium pentaromativorans]|uniref:LysR family transcriptional regulator n=1 Tax=Novosphingobium pentaromativorans US6-1 TaxID=1088721 RepID=G6EHB4_9SPHN|nr:LysR family transcriptional regulator [Novosphingobium pentaromativorans]AIT81921.1 LysR family transcriptional regulator [Novosphingobium pentaromativorans US6-1]EHJ59403.1 LysR family transcriptional regulator [Novosphingobium pentaromativorans US6-1]